MANKFDFNFINDEYELITDDVATYEKALKEMSAERKWYNVDEDYHEKHPDAISPKANLMAFFPLHNEPILAATMLGKTFEKERKVNGKIKKFTYVMSPEVTEDVIMDSMSEDLKNYSKNADGYHGTSLMAAVDKSNVYPVGWSAVSALQKALGLRNNGQLNLQSFNPDYLAAVYDMLSEAALGKGFTACTAYGKWRALNGPRYAVTDDCFIWEECKNMMKQYPKASFSVGYMSHTLTRWVIDFADYSDTLFGKYKAELGAKFTPVLIVETSITGDNAVNLLPGIKVGNIFVPLPQNISKRHTAGGNYEERIATMHKLIKQAFTEIMPVFEDAAKEAVKLQSIQLQYGRTTLERAAEWIALPQKETLAQAEIFGDMYAVENNGVVSYPNVSAYDMWLFLCEIVAEAEISGRHNKMALIGMEEGLSRAVRMDWRVLDDGRPARWNNPKKP